MLAEASDKPFGQGRQVPFLGPDGGNLRPKRLAVDRLDDKPGVIG